MSRITILLATYNGAKYLEQQLESIIAQSYQDWELVIHDDGSSDSTLEILCRYEGELPGKILVVRDGVRAGGAKQNFSHLLGFAKGDYVMFCDQDDVWLPKKVERTLSVMLQEEQFDPGKPVLVHTDLKVVDQNLTVICDSMVRGQRLLGGIENLDEVLMCNSVTGCTVMINSALRELSTVIPDEAVMHDWWLACVALRSGGKIGFIDEPLILYRQHGDNTVGFKGFGVAFLFKKFMGLADVVKSYRAAVRQARALDSTKVLGANYLMGLKVKCFKRKLFARVD